MRIQEPGLCHAICFAVCAMPASLHRARIKKTLLPTGSVTDERRAQTSHARKTHAHFMKLRVLKYMFTHTNTPVRCAAATPHMPHTHTHTRQRTQTQPAACTHVHTPHRKYSTCARMSACTIYQQQREAAAIMRVSFFSDCMCDDVCACAQRGECANVCEKGMRCRCNPLPAFAEIKALPTSKTVTQVRLKSSVDEVN